MNIIGSSIKGARESNNLTQKDLADKCSSVGFYITRGGIAKIESRCRKISDEEVFYFAQVLGVDIGFLYKQVSTLSVKEIQ